MEIKNRARIEFRGDVCGRVQTLYESENMSLAYVVIEEAAKSHKHERMEEVYYIQRGEGILQIGDERMYVRAQDIIPIPKGKFHHLKRISLAPLELIVATTPKYDPSDVHEENGGFVQVDEHESDDWTLRDPPLEDNPYVINC